MSDILGDRNRRTTPVWVEGDFKGELICGSGSDHGPIPLLHSSPIIGWNCMWAIPSRVCSLRSHVKWVLQGLCRPKGLNMGSPRPSTLSSWHKSKSTASPLRCLGAEEEQENMSRPKEWSRVDWERPKLFFDSFGLSIWVASRRDAN